MKADRNLLRENKKLKGEIRAIKNAWRKREGLESQTWENERPNWCPHTDCGFIRITGGLMCGGRLPKSIEHDSDFNTHRLCLEGAADSGGVFDLQVNKTDLYRLRELCEAMRKDAATLSELEEE